MEDNSQNGAAISNAERIAALRKRALTRKDPEATARSLRGAVVTACTLRASEPEPSWQARRGMLVRDRLSALRFAIDEYELLAGRLLVAPPDDPDELRQAEAYLSNFPVLHGQTGHCELDFNPLMHDGIDEMRRQILLKASSAEGAAHDVYRSFVFALDGLSAMIEHAAEATELAIAGALPARQTKLREIASSCRRIAHAAPASFRDAIQLLWFTIFAVMHGEQASLVVLGHLDRTLAPFYDADVASGTLTSNEALALIECLYLLVNEYIADGLAMSVMVGGRDAQGRDVTNDLSYLCLEALRRTNLIYPTVGVCWHEGTPDALVDLAVDLMGKGYPTPALFGDATIQTGLRRLGVPPEEACRYINSTCVEITPSGASGVWVASPYYNTCGVLLEEIAAQQSDLAPDFATFLARYRTRLAGRVAGGVARENAWRLARQAYGRRPLQSVFTRDCLARARDLDDGGAVYNWIECSFIGLANLTDSLHVIREEVYEKRRITLAELKTVLDANFVGYEPLRQRWLNAYPKYGQGESGVDALMGDMVQFVADTCAGFSVEPDGSAYVPGAFAWVMHERLGRETPATPDGRLAGFPFADGCGPAQGREAHGPTAAVLSVTSWDHCPMIGGLAFNLKFNSSLFRSPEGFAGLKALLLTYLRRGGFEAQVNVVDGATLRKAREHPELYRDLIVRIGGYTDYFTRLSLEMQDELILRTEFTAL